MEDDKKEQDLDIEEQLDPTYLRARDTGMLDGIFAHLDREYPGVRAYVELAASRYAKSLASKLERVSEAIEDEEMRKELMKKFQGSGNQ